MCNSHAPLRGETQSAVQAPRPIEMDHFFPPHKKRARKTPDWLYFPSDAVTNTHKIDAVLAIVASAMKYAARRRATSQGGTNCYVAMDAVLEDLHLEGDERSTQHPCSTLQEQVECICGSKQVGVRWSRLQHSQQGYYGHPCGDHRAELQHTTLTMQKGVSPRVHVALLCDREVRRRLAELVGGAQVAIPLEGTAIYILSHGVDLFDLLGRILRNEALASRYICLAKQIAVAVRRAAGSGYINTDIKPENMVAFYDDERFESTLDIKMIDWDARNVIYVDGPRPGDVCRMVAVQILILLKGLKGRRDFAEIYKHLRAPLAGYLKEAVPDSGEVEHLARHLAGTSADRKLRLETLFEQPSRLL